MFHSDNVVREACGKITELLRSKGKLEQHNVIRTIYHYEDDRIDIKGFLPMNLLDPSLDFFESLHLALKMPAEKHLSFPNGVPAFTSDELTLVFYAFGSNEKLLIPYYRPGHWLRYLDHLHQENEAEKEFARSMHGKAIADLDLFPEFNSPDEMIKG